MVMVNSNGQTVVHMKVNFLIIISTEKVNIDGQMSENIVDNGKIIRWRVLVYLFGLMEDDM